MRFKNLFFFVSRYRIRIKPSVTTFGYKYFRVSDGNKPVCNSTRLFSTSVPFNSRIHHENNDSDDDADMEYTNLKINEGYARDLLYKNPKDLLLHRIYCCSSVQELLNMFNTNRSYYKPQHITQTIFVLYDLQRIYEEIAAANMKNVGESSREFLDRLQENDSFEQLLKLVEIKIHSFDLNTLSYSLLYLTKLGLNLETPVMVILCETLKKNLINNFSLSPASRFLETVFSEYSVRSYFMSEELIPLVIKQIDTSTTNSLYDLSLSLNKLHNIITEETLDKYKRKVEGLIKTGSLTSTDYKAVLQIISFLNYPKWREKNSVLISKCILLIKDNLNQLSINEIILVYEIFFRIQEPGEILNDLQRSSSRYFHQLDDTPTTHKITLFSTLIYFASPKSRIEFHKILRKYVEQCNDYDNLFHLRKLLSYVKISDVKLCQLYWNKILKFLKNKHENIDLIKLSQNYINFSSDVDSYRHFEFEAEMLKLFGSSVKDPNYDFFPQKLISILNFVLMYSENMSLLDYLVTKIETNWQQLKHVDCLKLSYTLKVFSQMEQNYLKKQYARRIDKITDQIIQTEVINIENDLWKNSALLKSCVYKNKVDTDLMNRLLNNFRSFGSITSKNVENIYYCFVMTNTLVPEIVDNITEYITTYKTHVLGFNVARVIYLCYCLGYQPKSLDKFSETVVNTIIRDQERMTGLLLIYSAIALCFFNKLPNSLIKSIFNVEFMEKLDKELENCYSKDKYPQRVRNHLMQLNRAVCLEYPESDVPWFHQKYVEEITASRDNKSSAFANKVGVYLRTLIQNKSSLAENVITPYGYEVDFVINLTRDDEIAIDESHCATKLALLLIPEYAYTKGAVSQLKGSFQLKRRHLEILGYKVIFIKFSDWIGLFYADERIDFLRDLIWPKRCSYTNKNILR